VAALTAAQEEAEKAAADRKAFAEAYGK